MHNLCNQKSRRTHPYHVITRNRSFSAYYPSVQKRFVLPRITTTISANRLPGYWVYQPVTYHPWTVDDAVFPGTATRIDRAYQLFSVVGSLLSQTEVSNKKGHVLIYYARQYKVPDAKKATDYQRNFHEKEFCRIGQLRYPLPGRCSALLPDQQRLCLSWATFLFCSKNTFFLLSSSNHTKKILSRLSFPYCHFDNNLLPKTRDTTTPSDEEKPREL